MKAELARHLGMPSHVVSKMLSGKRAISAEELAKIADFFKVLPPGFEFPSQPRVVDQQDVREFLVRNILEENVDALMHTIESLRQLRQLRELSRAEPSRSPSDGQSEPASDRRE